MIEQEFCNYCSSSVKQKNNNYIDFNLFVLRKKETLICKFPISIFLRILIIPQLSHYLFIVPETPTPFRTIKNVTGCNLSL